MPADTFTELGKPGNEGMAFAITLLDFAEVYGSDPANFPNPDYEHGVFLDTATGNYIVVRPTVYGEYDWGKTRYVGLFKRIR